MRYFKLKILSAFFFLGLSTVPVQAQPAGKYVTGATLLISTGDWAQVYLNGHKFMDQDPNTSSGRGYESHRFERDELCYFGAKNVLAFEITRTIGNDVLSRNDSTAERMKDISFSYNLILDFSDGEKSEFVLSSNETEQNLELEILDKMTPKPESWNDPSYNDQSWQVAKKGGAPQNISKFLKDSKTKKQADYIFVFKSDLSLTMSLPGFRYLFRRDFNLDIIPAPGCPQPRIVPTVTPRPRPTATPSWTHTPIPPPRPTATASFTRTHRPEPTATPTPRPVLRRPTVTPVPVRKRRVIPTWTPTRVVVPTEPTPIKRRAWPTDTPTPRPWVPTPTFTEVALGEALPQTIVFVNPPVNILVSFKDGAGKYKVEVVDSRERHIQTLYEKRVSFEKETWLTWNGTDEGGVLQAYGHYAAVFSKDGKVLRHIALEWIHPDY